MGTKGYTGLFQTRQVTSSFNYFRRVRRNFLVLFFSFFVSLFRDVSVIFGLLTSRFTIIRRGQAPRHQINQDSTHSKLRSTNYSPRPRQLIYGHLFNLVSWDEHRGIQGIASLDCSFIVPVQNHFRPFNVGPLRRFFGLEGFFFEHVIYQGWGVRNVFGRVNFPHPGTHFVQPYRQVANGGGLTYVSRLSNDFRSNSFHTTSVDSSYSEFHFGLKGSRGIFNGRTSKHHRGGRVNVFYFIGYDTTFVNGPIFGHVTFNILVLVFYGRRMVQILFFSYSYGQASSRSRTFRMGLDRFLHPLWSLPDQGGASSAECQ